MRTPPGGEGRGASAATQRFQRDTVSIRDSEPIAAPWLGILQGGGGEAEGGGGGGSNAAPRPPAPPRLDCRDKDLNGDIPAHEPPSRCWRRGAGIIRAPFLLASRTSAPKVSLCRPVRQPWMQGPCRCALANRSDGDDDDAQSS